MVIPRSRTPSDVAPEISDITTTEEAIAVRSALCLGKIVYIKVEILHVRRFIAKDSASQRFYRHVVVIV
jgi:hypothetical protein